MCFAIRAGALTGEVSAYSSKNAQRGNQSTEFGHLHRPYVVGFITHEACVSSKNLFLGGNALNLGKCAGPALLCLRMFVGSMPYA
jgi:hypothetical protein